MGKTHSPLLGFNNNVRHKNRVFHIQTEDSGVKHPHIITHLFMDGGRILKSVKKSYAEHVGADGMQDTVRQMMKEQHKAMFIALRDGQFDAVVDEQLASKTKYDAELAAKKGQKPAAAPAVSTPPKEPKEGVEATGVDTTRESLAPAALQPAAVPAQASAPELEPPPVAAPAPSSPSSPPSARASTQTQKMGSRPPPEGLVASKSSPAPPPLAAVPHRPTAQMPAIVPAPPPPVESQPHALHSPLPAPIPLSRPSQRVAAANPVVLPAPPPVPAGAQTSAPEPARSLTPGKQRLVVLPEPDEGPPVTTRDPAPPPPLEIDLNASPAPPRLEETPAELFRANDLPPPPQNLLKRREITADLSYRNVDRSAHTHHHRGAAGASDEERPRPKSAPPPRPNAAAASPKARPATPAPPAASAVGGARHAPTAAAASPSAGPGGSSAPGRYAPARPATIFGAPRGKASIFGDDLVTDKSLDEVILSYLAEDLEQAPKKK